jgi:hypothetical protein
VTTDLPDDLSLHLEAELAALKRLEGVEGVPPDYLRFREEIARFQANGRAMVRRARSGGSGPGAGASQPRPGRLNRESIHLDGHLLRHMLRELRAIARAPPDEDPLSLLLAAGGEEPELLEALAASAAFDEGGSGLEAIGQRIGVAPPVLALAGRILAAPFAAEARHARGALAEVDARGEESTEAVRCPTCGSAPSLAVLDREDGRRRLFCSLCGEAWIAPRLICVYCGTTSPPGLDTLHVHEQDPRWIETCDTCRHYIRTIDLRRLPEDYVLVPGAEEAATLHLDVMAEEAGYVRPVL